MSTLLIKPKEFDPQVWQLSSVEFTMADYNRWLKTSVIPALQRIYDALDGADITSSEDDYLLGDTINMLNDVTIQPIK